MTKNKRILVNFIATYGRSVFAMACGLFTSRWVLMALGERDYGLFGLVGGVTVFVTFLNDLLSSAISRYYAYSVGLSQREKDGDIGLYECQCWFNTAVIIHTFLPCILLVIGYFIGIWAVECYLEIPAERMSACIWVFRWACLSCFINMVNVPFRAMYVAKQEIAELTIYSFAQTVCNVIFVYYMVSNPGDWLASYAFWMFILSLIPNIIIMLRAKITFRECKFISLANIEWKRFRELFAFALYRFWGALAIMLQGQGSAILVNKFLGVEKNATMMIGNTVSSHTTTLSSAMDGALQPAIANEYGAGNLDRMRSLALRTCKFSALSVLIFAIPLILEIDKVLEIWLKNPPSQASLICFFLIIVVVLEKISCGHYMVIFAVGKIAKYQFFIGLSGLIVLPIAWTFLEFTNLGIASIGIALVAGKLCAVGARLFYGRIQGGLSVKHWIVKVVFPLSIGVIISAIIGIIPLIVMPPSFLRILITSFICSISFILTSWCYILDASERNYIKSKIFKR